MGTCAGNLPRSADVAPILPGNSDCLCCSKKRLFGRIVPCVNLHAIQVLSESLGSHQIAESAPIRGLRLISVRSDCSHRQLHFSPLALQVCWTCMGSFPELSDKSLCLVV